VKKRDELDNQILNMLQNNFPVSLTPYTDMAVQLGIEEEEMINRIKVLREDGIIRRIGGIVDSRALGFYSTLCACQVPDQRVDEVGEIISSYPQVTHNYVRDHHDYNIWFTLTAESEELALSIIAEMEKRTATSIVNMPAEKVYKIKVSFEMEPAHEM
jgi:DNA-binding Lrp family transcriptional regulator